MSQGGGARKGLLVPRRVVEETVHAVPRDAARGAHRVFRAGDGFEVSIPESVLQRAVTFGRAQAPLEWLGLLVGRRCEDARGRHTLLLGVVRDVEASGERHFVTSTLESEGRIRALIREQFPDCVTLGWIHGHVRHGAAYSSFDFRCQATWSDADSLGVVVDPWDEKLLAVYRGPRGERLREVTCAALPVRDEDSPAREVVDRPAGRAAGEPANDRAASRPSHGLGVRALLAPALLIGLWAGYTDARVSRLEARHVAPRTAASVEPAGRSAPRPAAPACLFKEPGPDRAPARPVADDCNRRRAPRM